MPKSATPDMVVGSSRFRSRGRFPALTYFHRDTLVGTCLQNDEDDDDDDAYSDNNGDGGRRPPSAAAVSLCQASAGDVRRMR